MALEYIYNAVKATAGQDFCICAEVADPTEQPITENCGLMLHNDKEMIAKIDGVYEEGVWSFVVPADVTKGLKGRYWYCICHGDVSLCFKQPIYLA